MSLPRITLSVPEELLKSFASGGKVEWVPKSLATVFGNRLDSRNLESPQHGLGYFAADTGGQE